MGRRHMAARLWRCASLLMLVCLAWASGARAEEVVEAWRSPCGRPWSVSVNQSDGSCWVAAGASVMHVAADGTVLSQTSGFWRPQSVSVNPTDGSCWVADSGSSQVVHLAEDGSDIWRGESFSGPGAVSVNSTDGSCWVADSGNSQVVHLASDGTELWRGGSFYRPGSVSVHPMDGSSWVTDWGHGQVVHLVIWFHDVRPDHWARQEIEACFVAGIVSGFPDGTYQPSMSVTRAQMAVFLVRALGYEPTGPADPQFWEDAYGYDPAEPTTWAVDFTDVPASGWGDPPGPYWAWFHIQRLYEIGVTTGVTATEYGPAQEVRRDQMAVFLIRALEQECANPCVDTTCWPYDPANPTTWAHDFADIPATGQDTCHGAHWAWFHIQALYETGVTLGCGDGTDYCPGASVRRDEMAAFLARAFLAM